MDKDIKGRRDFAFVDGMRAVAAIAVTVLHASLYTGYEGDLTRDAPYLSKFLFVGNYAVSVFIVLSGFVLSLPIVKDEKLEIRRGTTLFLIRRARRILPPYFAALVLFGLLILAVPLMQTPRGTAWDSKVPVTPDGLLAHIALVHNLNKDWAYQVNGPAWSIATEWQLYLALPLLILPIWRWLGTVWMLLICLILSGSLAIFVPALDAGHLWFLSLFAMGGVVAQLLTSGKSCAYLGSISIVAALGSAFCVLFTPMPLWLNEIIVGATISCCLLWMAQRSVSGRQTIFHRVLESRPLVWLGLWSYSLYLIHSPLLGLGNLLALDMHMSTMGRFAFMIFVVTPMAAGVALVFHMLVERRFITQHQKTSKSILSAGDSKELLTKGRRP